VFIFDLKSDKAKGKRKYLGNSFYFHIPYGQTVQMEKCIFFFYKDEENRKPVNERAQSACRETEIC